MNAIMGWLAGLLALVPWFGAAPPAGFTGYIEADYIYVGPVTPGPIISLPVHDGEAIKKGDIVFVLDHKAQDALLAASQAQADAAEATLENLQTGGRPEELAASQAAVAKANADLELAQTSLMRAETLFAKGVITRAELDQDRSNVQSAKAGVNQSEAQLAVTGLGARPGQIAAARANLAAAKANVDKAKSDLADRTARAPADGRVEKVFFDPGEMVTTGVPVVSILPASGRKVEFFVEEGQRDKFALGQKVSITCDGCKAGLTGEVTYLASQPQYTSPIIYSRDERGQLVFLTEARLEDPGAILPGQPVTVSIAK